MSCCAGSLAPLRITYANHHSFPFIGTLTVVPMRLKISDRAVLLLKGLSHLATKTMKGR